MTPTSTRETSDAVTERRRGQRGFTLIELSLVLLIVGVLVAIAVPRLPSLGGVRLDAEAGRLATRMAYLTDEAALRGRIYRMTLDLDRDIYTTDALLPYADAGGTRDFQSSWDPYAEDVTLDDTLDLSSLETADGLWQSGAHPLYFFPEGESADAIVTLARSDGSESLAVHLEEGSGEIRIAAPTEAEGAGR